MTPHLPPFCFLQVTMCIWCYECHTVAVWVSVWWEILPFPLMYLNSDHVKCMCVVWLYACLCACTMYVSAHVNVMCVHASICKVCMFYLFIHMLVGTIWNEPLPWWRGGSSELGNRCTSFQYWIALWKTKNPRSKATCIFFQQTMWSGIDQWTFGPDIFTWLWSWSN